MNMKKIKDSIETISSSVHDSWWKEKNAQGFHSPMECKSESAKEAHRHALRDYANFDFPKFNKFCEKCHTDMYPYGELPENVKEYDRVTVRTVISAIEKLQGDI